MKRSPVTPSLYAPDVSQSVAFFVNTLGFQQTGAWTDDDGSEVWAEVSLDHARIWFFANPLDDVPAPVFSGLIYVFLDDVDAFAARVGELVSAVWGPETQVYGLREFAIRDSNGYLFVFAKDV